MPKAAPYVLCVGGVDPRGGAGVLRDWHTCRQLGAACEVVVTAWTDQGPGGVRSIDPRAPDVVARGILDAFARATAASPQPVGIAVKIGMVATASTAAAIAGALDELANTTAGPVAVVFDPVLFASSGGSLFSCNGRAADALGAMLTRVTLVTPNASELEQLTGVLVTDGGAAVDAAVRLVDRGARAVLAKGGHVGQAEAVDWLVERSPVANASDRVQTRALRGPRLVGDPRGTGCALATAIATRLARGDDLHRACSTAKTWLAERIASAIRVGDELQLP